MTKYRFQTHLTDTEKYKLTILMFMTGGPMFRQMKKFIMFILVISICIFIYNNNYGSNHSKNILIFMFPLLLVLFLFIFPFLYIKFRKTNNPTYEFDDDGMTIINDSKKKIVSWSKLDEYMETPNYILIKQYPSQLFSHVIKKSVLNNQNNTANFIDLLEMNGVKRK